MTARWHHIILLALVLTACSKDNFLRLSSNGSTKNLIPDFTNAKRFRSNNGDTITLRQLSLENSFEKSDRDLATGGGLPDFDYVELERSRLVVGSDTPYLRFTYDLLTSYNSALPTRAQDNLSLIFEEGAGTEAVSMNFEYTDTLLCLSERCTYQDTFVLQLREFSNVYFTRRDSISRNALYIDESNGLIGFKTSDNRIFELIP